MCTYIWILHAQKVDGGNIYEYVCMPYFSMKKLSTLDKSYPSVLTKKLADLSVQCTQCADVLKNVV